MLWPLLSSRLTISHQSLFYTINPNIAEHLAVRKYNPSSCFPLVPVLSIFSFLLLPLLFSLSCTTFSSLLATFVSVENILKLRFLIPPVTDSHAATGGFSASMSHPEEGPDWHLCENRYETGFDRLHFRECMGSWLSVLHQYFLLV